MDCLAEDGDEVVCVAVKGWCCFLSQKWVCIALGRSHEYWLVDTFLEQLKVLLFQMLSLKARNEWIKLSADEICCLKTTAA